MPACVGVLKRACACAFALAFYLRACVRDCVRACVRECERVFLRASMFASEHARMSTNGRVCVSLCVFLSIPSRLCECACS